MRYVVIGTSGAGKSTIAQIIAGAIGAPFVELDDLYWGANWTARPLPVFEQSVREATAGDRWVVAGGYSAVSNIFWPNATDIIWLNFSRRVVFSRVIWRTFKRSIMRERLWSAGNRELLRRALFSKDSILWWSFKTYRKNQIKYAKLRASAEYGHLQWHELRTPAQAAAFLAGISKK